MGPGTLFYYKFLIAIMTVESSGGKNTNHEPITKEGSMHYGQRATGRFALMPNTIAMLTRGKRRALKTGSREEVDVALKYAHKLWNKARERHPECLIRNSCHKIASFMWFTGPNHRYTDLKKVYARPRVLAFSVGF